MQTRGQREQAVCNTVAAWGKLWGVPVVVLQGKTGGDRGGRCVGLTCEEMHVQHEQQGQGNSMGMIAAGGLQ